MSKEIYISTTPHETRLAIVEDEQLTEIYYERENEYTLAGSIYNGKVTRVLPGMQSSFVDIGLERDAFLYVTDFMEEAGDSADFETDGGGSRRQQAPRTESKTEGGESRPQAPKAEGGEGRSQGGREGGGRNRRGRGADRGERRPAAAAGAEAESTTSFEEPIAPAPSEAIGSVDAEGEGGSRRWRGRRGRRRGRGSREDQPAQGTAAEPGQEAEFAGEDAGSVDIEATETSYEANPIEIDLNGEVAAPASGRPREDRGGRGRGGRGRDRDRGGRGGSDRGDRGPRSEAAADRPAAPAFDNSYAGYYDDTAPEPTGEPTLLPGESIRKYRDPEEVAAEDAEARRNAPPAPEVLVVAAPNIEIVGWDGGAVLPGESLGRNRGRSNTPKASHAAPAPVATYKAPEPVAPAPVAAAPVADEPEAPGEVDLGATPSEEIAAEAPPAVEAAFAHEAVQETAEESAVVAAAEATTEYEPHEGASAGTTDADRRDLRWFGSKDKEEKKQAKAKAAAEATSFTTLQSSGEMLSVPAEAVEQGGVLPLASQDQPTPASPIAHQDAVQSVNLADATTTPLSVSAAEQEEADADGMGLEIHAYGEGDFHEEEIDELDDDLEYEATAGGEEESEEYEEETLEGSADVGSMLHDMAIDREASGDDEDDFEESAAGGFTEDDFGGEQEEEGAAGEPANTGTAEPRRREGGGFRRGGSGGGRDRRGGRSSGGDRGGRSGGRRQSMQTTDLPAINELLKPGQEILVQIAKEPIAKKGARITSHIALPGRFLVFMPTVNHTGVSRKISSDEERRRLKSILLSEKGDASGGFIVRTAADGASEEELRTDLRFLIQMWTDIKQRSEASKSPALIYHDLNLVERILRDQVTDNFSAIWVDTEQEYERVLRFLQRFQPSLIRRVKLYTKETPIFEHFGVTAEIDKALKSKVWLKSGGSIVINQTEALVAIDINTGKYVGKTARLEDTIVKTNLDSIPEIVRQIRLRDLGGIIVIDFIDMDERKNRAKVLQALEDAMRADRAPSKILPFNDFGLVIMTRKRVKQSLERTLCMPDPVTEGTGMIKSPVTIANEIYVEMKKMHRHLEKTDVMLRVHPEVVKTLKANGGKRLQELEDMTKKTILVKSDPALSPESFDIH